MNDPYVRWRSTALWRAVEHWLVDCESAGKLRVAPGGHADLIGQLCSLLDADGHLAGSRLARVRQVFVESGCEPLGIDATGVALEACAVMDRGAGQEELADYVANYHREALEVQRIMSPDFSVLARRLLEAYYGLPR